MHQLIVNLFLAFPLLFSARTATAIEQNCAFAFDHEYLQDYREIINEGRVSFPELAKLSWHELNTSELSNATDIMVWRYIAHRALVDFDSPFHEMFVAGFLRYAAIKGDTANIKGTFTDLVHGGVLNAIASRGLGNKTEDGRDLTEPVQHVLRDDVEQAIDYVTSQADNS